MDSTLTPIADLVHDLHRRLESIDFEAAHDALVRLDAASRDRWASVLSEFRRMSSWVDDVVSER